MINTLKKTICCSFNIITVLVVLCHAIPVDAQIDVLNVEITTADKFAASTNDDVVLELMVSPVDSNGDLEKHEYFFENNGDLFERGDTNNFRITENLPEHPCEIISIRIRKAKVHLEGGWYFGGLRLYYNDDPSTEFYQISGLEVWLRGSDVDWSPSDYPIENCDVSYLLDMPPECPPVPAPCVVEIIHDLPVQYPDSDCDGVADQEDDEPNTPGIDSDADCIPDAREEVMGTDPNNPEDSDGDGIPDLFEDRNRDGVVDTAAGESDPHNPDENSDGELDGAEDQDGDGLPDWYEIEMGMDPNHVDSDGDGWFDGYQNTRTFLILRQIHCENEKEDTGHDEYFLVIDDVRFPEDSRDIDGRFRLEKGDIVNPDIIVARRVHSPSQAADYVAVVEMWEDDTSDSSDDYWQTDNVRFGESGQITIDRDVSSFLDNTIYHVTFLAYSRPFRDPHPIHANGEDSDTEDADGLWDDEEHLLSGELGGLSDPSNPDIFLEMDWVGADQEPEPWSKRDVVSQFYYHDYVLHLDDGNFQHINHNYGGENLSYSGAVFLLDRGGTPSAEQIAEADGRLVDFRRGLFHYVIAVDEVGDYPYGVSATKTLNDNGEIVCGCGGSRTGLSVFRSDYFDASFDGEAIFFMHELGHDFGLCHRPGDIGYTVAPAPLCVGLSPTPADCDGPCNNCSHYWVDEESRTAMGSWSSFNAIYSIIGLCATLIFVSLPLIVIGAVLGGSWLIALGVVAAVCAVGGFLGGGFFGDPIARDVMYSAAEWSALNLRAIRCW